MNTKIEYKRSKENQQNHELVPLLMIEIYSLLKAIDDHDCNKITVDGKLLLAIDHAQELVDSIK